MRDAYELDIVIKTQGDLVNCGQYAERNMHTLTQEEHGHAEAFEPRPQGFRR